jgi:hypothetical protein
MQEIWLPVEGYEGYYEVSNLGRIKNIKSDKEKILKPSIDTGGYAYNPLRKDNKFKNFSIHRLVATAFLKKENYQCQVNHINGIKIDNRVENLEWVSAIENYCHRSLLKKYSSKYTGVSYKKSSKKWVSQICINKKVFYLGVFNTEEEAYLARVNYELNNNINNKYR